jgi:quercetin dioxygenase-like cupin family protein
MKYGVSQTSVRSIPAGSYQTLLSGAETNESFGLVTLTLPPHDDSSNIEVHPYHAKGCYVLRGTLAVTIGECTVTMQPGEAVYVAPGVDHSYWNPTAAQVEALLFFTPCDNVRGNYSIIGNEDSSQAAQVIHDFKETQ